MVMAIQDFSEEQVKEILKGIKIPAQPQIMVDLQIEQAMPDPDVNRITELISHDASLAGAILKVVNSSFYALPNKITSIHQAVNILGMNSVINIVNGLSIKSALSDGQIKELTRFWDSAMDIAMVSTTIAKQVKYSSPDKAYALGLFHNIGIPLLMGRFDNYLGYLLGGYASNQERVIDFESQQLNCNHEIVGYYMAKSWNLPKVLCEVIAEHHSSIDMFTKGTAVRNEKNTLLAILKLSEHISGLYIILGQQDVDHEWNLIENGVLEYLGLNEYDLDTLKVHFSEMGIPPENYGAI
jgi:HD-like signal output (HDOD) protein